MSLVVVEREFDAPQNLSELQAREEKAAWCLATRRVRQLKTYFSADSRHMVCVYDAPDTESVRATQRTAGLPVKHAWSATPLTNRPIDMPEGYSLVVVQREMPEGTTAEDVRKMLASGSGCLGRMRLHYAMGFQSLDVRRFVCTYYSPDLESVRVQSREGGIPLERLWKAELIEAP
jgi:hypothetical protein